MPKWRAPALILFYLWAVFAGAQGNIKQNLMEFGRERNEALIGATRSTLMSEGTYVDFYFPVKVFTDWLFSTYNLNPGPNDFFNIPTLIRTLMTQLSVWGISCKKNPYIWYKRDNLHMDHRTFLYREQFACCWHTRMLPTAECQRVQLISVYYL